MALVPPRTEAAGLTRGSAAAIRRALRFLGVVEAVAMAGEGPPICL
jgi:hypothetical protein